MKYIWLIALGDHIEDFLEKHMHAYTRMCVEDSDKRYIELKRHGLV